MNNNRKVNRNEEGTKHSLHVCCIFARRLVVPDRTCCCSAVPLFVVVVVALLLSLCFSWIFSSFYSSFSLFWNTSGGYIAPYPSFIDIGDSVCFYFLNETRGSKLSFTIISQSENRCYYLSLVVDVLLVGRFVEFCAPLFNSYFFESFRQYDYEKSERHSKLFSESERVFARKSGSIL